MINSIAPSPTLSCLVDSFWMLRNDSQESKQLTILPDGRIDLLFSESPKEAFHATLLGLATQASPAVIEAGWSGSAISFNPLATEYLLKQSVADLLNTGKTIETGKWTFTKTDLKDFDHFILKAEKMITAALPNDIDPRKKNLFDLIFASKGSIPVKELSEKYSGVVAKSIAISRSNTAFPSKLIAASFDFAQHFHNSKKVNSFPKKISSTNHILSKKSKNYLEPCPKN